MGKIKREIMNILQEMKGMDFKEEYNLISGGFLDSFELLMFIKELEEYFEICIPIEKVSLEEFNSINNVCEIVKKTVGSNGKIEA